MQAKLVTAFHEAGHAVAARLRSATVHSMQLDPGLMTYSLPRSKGSAPKLFRNGVQVAKRTEQLQARELTEADAFIAFAGPWAAVRCRWNLPLDATDEHGNTFSTYLDAVLRTNTTDYATYLEAPKPAGIEQLWSHELERYRPVISVIAKKLYAEHRDRKRPANYAENRLLVAMGHAGGRSPPLGCGRIGALTFVAVSGSQSQVRGICDGSGKPGHSSRVAGVLHWHRRGIACLLKCAV